MTSISSDTVAGGLDARHGALTQTRDLQGAASRNTSFSSIVGDVRGVIRVRFPAVVSVAALRDAGEATRDIPVIALTALAMKGDEERIRGAGCAGYIAKPMGYRETLATIAAQLRSA